MRECALVAGNWKMNGTRSSVAALLNGIRDGLGPAGLPRVEVLVCPPFVFIPEAAQRLEGSPIVCGAQNLDVHESGAYTGEISGAMLRDFGCRYCIVGHSERRALYGETNELVAEKFIAAQRAALTPMLCVGETLEQREGGATEHVIGAQLDAVFEVAGVSAFERAVVAYEPVWAIGTGKTATPDQAQAVHAFIRDRVAGHDASLARTLRILYGGSVNAGNAATLFAQADVDGGLVGGASLQAADFVAICQAVGMNDD